MACDVPCTAGEVAGGCATGALEGETMENSRVVELVLDGFGLSGGVPTEVGQLALLRNLYVGGNALTSLPAEIGQLGALKGLYLSDN